MKKKHADSPDDKSIVPINKSRQLQQQQQQRRRHDSRGVTSCWLNWELGFGSRPRWHAPKNWQVLARSRAASLSLVLSISQSLSLLPTRGSFHILLSALRSVIFLTSAKVVHL